LRAYSQGFVPLTGIEAWLVPLNKLGKDLVKPAFSGLAWFLPVPKHTENSHA